MSDIWVLVADNSRARIFSADKPASPLTEIQDFAHPEARLHESEITTDSSFIDHENALRDESANRFASSVCSALESGRMQGRFNKLYVVAAPGFLGKIRKTLSSPTRKLVAAEINKNISTQDPGSIRTHLPQYL